MKKIILFIFLIFVQNAYGKWLLIDDQKITKHFVDIESIKTNGNIRKVWTHQEYSEPQKGIKSSVLQIELDCDKQLVHPLFAKSYRESNLEGNSVESDVSNKSSWIKISKNDDKEFYSYYMFSCFYKPIKSYWSLFSSSNLSELYIDKNTLIRDGNRATIQGYSNILDKKVGLDGVGSLQSLYIFECKDETFKFTNSFSFPQKNLQGNLIDYFISPPEHTIKLSEDNFYYNLMKFACNSK